MADDRPIYKGLYDNGLLRYYSSSFYKDGFLDVKRFGLREVVGKSFLQNTTRCISSFGNFYKKYCNYFSKEMVDAEILLSQIYSKAGLISAIYTPAQQDGKLFLLSNDVFVDGVVPSKAFHEYISLMEGDEKEDYAFIDLTQQSIAEKYFTTRALEQKLKMRVLDVACCNPDRERNYFYKLDEKEEKVEDVVLIDYERSGVEVGKISSGKERVLLTDSFASDYLGCDLTRMEMVDYFRNNPFVSKNSLCQMLGSVNVQEIALDISRDIGYVVNPEYVDYIDSSFSRLEKDLAK